MALPKLPVSCERSTRETIVRIVLEDGEGLRGSSGIPFFDHMLDTLAHHAHLLIKLDVRVLKDSGDDHHIVEDVAIVLGSCFDKALGDRRGLERFGHALVPMDDALAFAAVDLVRRGYFQAYNFDVLPRHVVIGGFRVENLEHFLRTLAVEARFTLHAGIIYGINTHHMIEAVVKAVAVAFRRAASPGRGTSAKGVL